MINLFLPDFSKKQIEMNAIQQQITEQIRRYFLMGLTYSEIGKLLDLSRRTVQRYVTAAGISEELKAPKPKNTRQKAFEFLDSGYSYSEVAKKLKVSKTTIYLWNRKRNEAQNQPKQEQIV